MKFARLKYGDIVEYTGDTCPYMRGSMGIVKSANVESEEDPSVAIWWVVFPLRRRINDKPNWMPRNLTKRGEVEEL